MSSSYPNDDLFETSKMSFGEHLEELRSALFKAIIGLVIGVLIGLSVGKYVVAWIEAPLKAALQEFYLKSATIDLQNQYPDGIPPELIAMITEEELIPIDIQIDPISFLDRLKLADPEQFGTLSFRPHRIGRVDIDANQVSSFCDDLIAADKSNTDSPAKHAWSLLDTDQQSEIKALAKQDAAVDAVGKIRAILNKLIEQDDLHGGESFTNLSSLDPNTELVVNRIRRQLEETPDADESRRLNRLLLSSAFPDLLRIPRLPLIDLPTWKPVEVKVQTLNAQEGFMIWIKASAVTGAVIASPWIFWQIWLFIAAGLYPSEQKYVYIYMPFSLVLFMAGVLLAFNYVFQPVLEFLFDFNLMLGLDPSPRISEWLSFVLFLPLGFGISFQLPLVMLFLQRIGIMTTAAYVSKWRIAVLVICVISMLLTPADPMSMLLMAVPLTFLYFAGILLCVWMPRTKSPFAEAEEI